MNKKVLVPLDGSPLAERALPHAAALARANNYGLNLLRVLVPPAPVATMAWSVAPTTGQFEDWNDEVAEAKTYMDSLAKRLRPLNLDVQITLIEDDPAIGITSYTEQHHEIAYVAMSTHGRSGLGRWVFGSVAERVLHSISVPLLLVRPHTQEDLKDSFEVPSYKSLLIPLDGSAFAAKALGVATTLVNVLHGTLTIVSAMPEQPIVGELIAPPALPVEWKDASDMVSSYLAQTRNDLEAQGFTVVPRLEYGQPAPAILHVAEATHADLIVMASHGRTGLPRLWLGSIAMKVVQASTCPVLLVHPTERVKSEQPEHAGAAAGVTLSLAF